MTVRLDVVIRQGFLDDQIHKLTVYLYEVGVNTYLTCPEQPVSNYNSVALGLCDVFPRTPPKLTKLLPKSYQVWKHHS